ncbi:MAG: ABC transporter permease [Myxococcales bacterium]|nr:ABC transporter permease [Myxococcales bacterium]
MTRSALAGRLVGALVTLALVVVIVFGIAGALADPAVIALGGGAPVDEVARLRHAWGLDRPWQVRLGELAWGLLHLDLGLSRIQQAPVSALIGRALAPTLAYALPGILLALALALAGGLAAARRPGGPIDRLVNLSATLLLSTSSVIVVLAAHGLLARRLGLFPIIGWPLVGSDAAAAGLVVLPALTWALLQLGPDLRHFRALFVRELDAPYLDGLRSRGIAEARVLGHALRGASGPILARLAARLPHLVVGSLVIEQVFNIPGIGGLALTALRTGDLALVEGLALLLALVTIVGQLLLDLAAAALDPRLAAGGER